MNESLKEKIKRIAKDKLGIRSWRDQVDENFENGTQVASAPFARAGKLIKGLQTNEVIDRILKADEDLKNGLITKEQRESIVNNLKDKTNRFNYYKKRNGADEFDNTPRDIIRDYNYTFPSDIVGEDLNSRVADVKKAREGFTKQDKSSIAGAARYREKKQDGAIDKVVHEMLDAGAPPVDTKIDWQAWLKQKQEGKEAGKEIAKQFSEQNKKEKAKYNQIAAGINGANSYIPEGYTGKIYRLKNKHVKFGGETYVTEEQLKNLRPDVLDLNTITEVKPTKALGGQNTKYLDRGLHGDSNQDIKSMYEAAKPIHYDENGNPYVRGFTWTQTGNVPKITNPDAGYLASVGADTEIYHANATPGHWTSEGWGNPMDLNYENHIAPGEVDEPMKIDKNSQYGNDISNPYDTRKFLNELLDHPDIDVSKGGDWDKLRDAQERYDADEINGIEFRDIVYSIANKYNVPTSKNFDEQLLETRWPLKWYQKAPSEHQPNAGEYVTVMNAGPGAKDIHRPIVKDVADKQRTGAVLQKKLDDIQRDYYAGKITEEEFHNLQIDLMGNLSKPVPTPVGTKVDKIATPANMITAHMEDNMPRNWSMRDRSNGGQSIAGWHPNKKWSSWNAGDFANHVKENMPTLYKQLSDEAEKEFGKSVDARRNAKNIHNYIGQYFIDNPGELETLTIKSENPGRMKMMGQIRDFGYDEERSALNKLLDREDIEDDYLADADIAELWRKTFGYKNSEIPKFKTPYEFSNWYNQR